MEKEDILKLGFKPISGKFNTFSKGEIKLYLSVGGYAKVNQEFCATIEDVKREAGIT